MEYLVPLVIVLVIVIVVVVASRFLGRPGRAEQDAPPAQGGDVAASKTERRGREVTREMAVEASSRLTPESHRAVYSLIARQQVLNAVKEYRRVTRLGLGESAAAVAALAQFPQPSPEPVLESLPVPKASPEPEPQPASEPLPAAIAPDAPLTVEDILSAAPAAPAAGAYRYRAIVSQGDEVREVVSTRLNQEIYGRICALARSGDYDGAARVLLDHANISPNDAREFVTMIGPED